MVKKIWASASVLLALCLLLAGCSLDIVSVDKLMRPPKLGGESSYLQAAFEKNMGESETVLMKAPLSGENRSSYLFFDIDKNGIDEALVFYSDPAVDEFAYFSLFKQVDGEWKSVADVKGRADEIYEVDFSDINGDGIYEILISWTTMGVAEGYILGTSKRALTVYNYNGSTATLIYSELFSKMLVEDLNGDGAEEIFIVDIDLSQLRERTKGRVLSFDRDYTVIYDKAFVMTGFIDIFNMVTDTLVENGKKYTRVYIDGGLSESAVATELVSIGHADFDITLPLYSANTAEASPTLRGTRIFSDDVDYDGVVEIPTTEPLPAGARISDENEERLPLNLTVWSEYRNGKVSVDGKSLVNASYGYMFRFPDEWINKITAVYNVKNATLSFYTLDENMTLGGELFRLGAFSRLQWEENSYGYTKYSENGAYVYGYIISEAGFDRKNIEDNFIITG